MWENGRFMELLAPIVVVFLWFLANISTSIVMKWLYLYGQVCKTGDELKGTVCSTFEYPLAITCIHMCCSWIACRLYLQWRADRAEAEVDAETPLRGAPKTRFHPAPPPEKVIPLAASFAMSVGMGNASLKYIYPSFSQMLGSMSPLVTVMLSFTFFGKGYNMWTWLSMPIICGGLVLCSSMEANFSLIGTSLAAGATVLRALKSILQERLLVDPEEKMDAVTTLYHMAPHAGLMLLVSSLALEGLGPVRIFMPTPGTIMSGVPALLMWLFASGLTACFLNVFGNQVTKMTSAVTLQVLGNVKSCMGILISVAIFRNRLEALQGVGVFVCLLGVAIYQSKGATTTRGMDASSAKSGHA